MTDKTQKTGSKKKLPLWQETSLLIVTALVMAVIVKTFFLQAFYIPSGSMEPTMMINDRVLVQKVSYWSNDVQRGDVIVFDDPGHWLSPAQSTTPHNFIQRALEVVGLYPTGGHLIKRVIGVGGDKVSCCDDQGRLTVNGEPLQEPYVLAGEPGDRKFSVKVPKGYLWVMGDNRHNSADSRSHMGEPGGGFVPLENVTGKAWLRVWPWDRIGFIHDPPTFDALNARDDQ